MDKMNCYKCGKEKEHNPEKMGFREWYYCPKCKKEVDNHIRKILGE